VRTLTHIAAVVALGAWAVALGRWLRDPAPGSGLVALLLLAAAIAIALRQLYVRPERAGGGPRGGEAPTVEAEPAGPEAEPAGPEAEALWEPEPEPLPDDPRVDVNAAGVLELQALPGVGPVAAARIVAEREAGGPFTSVEELVRVPGFGPAKVRVLADAARVGRAPGPAAPGPGAAHGSAPTPRSPTPAPRPPARSPPARRRDA
jgi:competence ComEA-like helix-hairpin-helix protein